MWGASLIKIIFQAVKEKIKRVRKQFQGVCERCDTPIDSPHSLDCYAYWNWLKHNYRSEKCIPHQKCLTLIHCNSISSLRVINLFDFTLTKKFTLFQYAQWILSRHMCSKDQPPNHFSQVKNFDKLILS